MTKRKHYIFLAILLIGLPLILMQGLVSKKAEGNIAPVKAPPIPKADPNPFIVELLADYERKIDSLSNQSHTPGAAIAIVYDTTIIFLKGVGVRKVGTTDLVDAHTVIRHASVSKSFASYLT